MKANVRKLTVDDIPAIDVEGLNGKSLVEYGYYKVSLSENPEIYCYARDFGGLKPEEIGPYLYVEKSKYFGDILKIDIAAIKNDERRNTIKLIPVVFVEDVPGMNAKIFQNLETKKYYYRLSSYPREKFARWMTCEKRKGEWQSLSEIRANILFSLDGQVEKVTCTNWNGPAVYEENFNKAFEKANYLVECLGCENIIDLAYCGREDHMSECPFCGFVYDLDPETMTEKDIAEIFKEEN